MATQSFQKPKNFSESGSTEPRSTSSTKSELNGDQTPGIPVDTTIFLRNNASLSLSLESLIIRGNEAAKKGDNTGQKSSSHSITLDTSASSEPVGSSATRAIPLYNILWANFSEPTITISYARQSSKTTVKPATLTFPTASSDGIDAWISLLLDRAYGKAQKMKRVRVLVNPKSGKGGAEKTYSQEVAPILDAANCPIDFTKTGYQGEATEIAEKLDVDLYDTVIACSGDGLLHEIFNGLGKRSDAKRALYKIALAHIPCGSGNGMSCNTNGNKFTPSMSALAIVKGIRTPLDLISITQGNTRILSFLSQAVGIVAEFDLATENLRWMGGTLRFTYGYLVRAMKKKVYPCDLAVKVVIADKGEIKAHYQRALNSKVSTNSVEDGDHKVDTSSKSPAGSEVEEGLPPLKYGTVNDKVPDDWEIIQSDKLGNFWCGNMAYMATDVNYFSAALPNDGLMDLVCINGDISRVMALKQLAAVDNGTFFGMPHVAYRKVLGYRIIPKNQADGYISIDGERVPFEPFQAEIHQGLGTVLSKTGHLYEAPGPK